MDIWRSNKIMPLTHERKRDRQKIRLFFFSFIEKVGWTFFDLYCFSLPHFHKFFFFAQNNKLSHLCYQFLFTSLLFHSFLFCFWSRKFLRTFLYLINSNCLLFNDRAYINKHCAWCTCTHVYILLLLAANDNGLII